MTFPQITCFGKPVQNFKTTGAHARALVLPMAGSVAFTWAEAASFALLAVLGSIFLNCILCFFFQEAQREGGKHRC